jgi:hypothetical protein
MKKNVLFFIFLILCGNVFASQTVTVNTKFGYLKDNNGNIIGKYDDVNKGPLVIPDGYIYIEVPDHATLKTIVVYQSPKQKQEALNFQALQEVVAKQMANDKVLPAQLTMNTKS